MYTHRSSQLERKQSAFSRRQFIGLGAAALGVTGLGVFLGYNRSHGKEIGTQNSSTPFKAFSQNLDTSVPLDEFPYAKISAGLDAILNKYAGNLYELHNLTIQEITSYPLLHQQYGLIQFAQCRVDDNSPGLQFRLVNPNEQRKPHVLPYYQVRENLCKPEGLLVSSALDDPTFLPGVFIYNPSTAKLYMISKTTLWASFNLNSDLVDELHATFGHDIRYTFYSDNLMHGTGTLQDISTPIDINAGHFVMMSAPILGIQFRLDESRQRKYLSSGEGINPEVKISLKTMDLPLIPIPPN